MSFKVNVSGMDALTRKLRELSESVKPSTTYRWAKIVEKTANEICSNHKTSKDFKVKIININNTPDSSNFSYEVADLESLDCLIKAVERNLKSMPDITRQIFENLLTQFKSKRDALKTGT